MANWSLVFGLILTLKRSGRTGKRLQAPPLVLLAVGVRRRELRQVPERPGHGPALADEGALLAPVPAEDAGRSLPTDGFSATMSLMAQVYAGGPPGLGGVLDPAGIHDASLATIPLQFVARSPTRAHP